MITCVSCVVWIAVRLKVVYADLPYNTSRRQIAGEGSPVDGALFDDIFILTAAGKEQYRSLEKSHPSLYRLCSMTKDYSRGDSILAFLLWVYDRMSELRRITRLDGSAFYQVDGRMAHWVKLLVPILYEREAHEIVWQRNSGRAKGNGKSPRSFGVDYDNILWVPNSDDYRFVGPYRARTEKELSEIYPKVNERGYYRDNQPVFRSHSSMGPSPGNEYTYNNVSPPEGMSWRVNRVELEMMDRRGDVVWADGKRPKFLKYAKDDRGRWMGNCWVDIPNVTRQSSEYSGYPTQKPKSLIRRLLHSVGVEPDDVILDPVMGSGTTALVAEELGCHWVGMDTNKGFTDNVINRFYNELGFDGMRITIIETPPVRTDNKNLPHPNYWHDDIKISQNNICMLCEEDMGEGMEIDHKVPRSAGGGDERTNLQGLHSRCNSKKGDRPWFVVKAKWREEKPRNLPY